MGIDALTGTAVGSADVAVNVFRNAHLTPTTPAVDPSPPAPVSVSPTPTGPNRIYSARELLRRAEEPGPYHNFPESFDNEIFENGTRTVVPDYYNKPRPLLSNDSVQYRLPGSINGREGVYEIFTRPSVSGNTEVIYHRFFRPS